MNENKTKGIIESILFATGREVSVNELMSALELSEEEVMKAIQSLKEDYKKEDRGIDIIKVENSYQLCTKKENYEYIYTIFDKRSKPSLSQAALETLAIIAYNPCVTRAEIESIRGVNSDGTIYKLLDYNLIEESGKLDAPGRPMTYKTSNEFLKLFGITKLSELPELPRYKLDENRQIVIDEILDDDVNSETNEKLIEAEAPMPEREEESSLKEEVENQK